MSVEIEAPDGAIIEFPDGTDQETIKSVMARRYGAPLDFNRSDEDIRKDINRLPETAKNDAFRSWARHGIARERAKGFTPLPDPSRGIPIIGGLVDEGAALAEAGLYTLTNGMVGRPYDEAVAFQRERHRQSEAESPALAFGSQLAAGVATGGPLFGRITGGTTTLGKIASGVPTGYALGRIEGFTRGEDNFSKRLNSSEAAGNFGALVGGATPIAGDIIRRGVGAYAQHIAPTFTRLRHGPEEAADQILARRIYRDGTTPAQIRRDLQTGQQRSAVLQGGGDTASRAYLPETIADTSDSMRRLAGTLYRSGGEAGNFVRQALDNRQRGISGLFDRITRDGTDGQHQRIMNAAERALLVRTAGTARQTERQITEEMRQQANTLYQRAYDDFDSFDLSPALAEFQRRAMEYQPSAIRSTLNRALRLFSDNAPGSKRVNNIRRFDLAKRSLDDLIEQAQRNGRGANLVRELTDFKNSLLASVHGPNGSLNRNYQIARDAWGSAAERRQAIDLGRSALRDGSEISAEQFRELTTGQQQLFRLGFLESLRNAIGSKGRGHDITRLFEQNRVRQLMSEIIPRSNRRAATFYNRPERFGDLIDREARMVQTRNAAMGNSMTQRNEVDDAVFAGDALQSMWNKFRSAPSLFNMGVEAIGSGLQRIFGYRQDVALALARRLLETDPNIRNQILQRLRQRSPQRFLQFRDLIDESQQAIVGVAPAQLRMESEAQ